MIQCIERNEGSCWTTFQAYSGGNCNLAQVSAISTIHSIQLSKLTQFNTLKVSEKYDTVISIKNATLHNIILLTPLKSYFELKTELKGFYG